MLTSERARWMRARRRGLKAWRTACLNGRGQFHVLRLHSTRKFSNRVRLFKAIQRKAIAAGLTVEIDAAIAEARAVMEAELALIRDEYKAHRAALAAAALDEKTKSHTKKTSDESK